MNEFNVTGMLKKIRKEEKYTLYEIEIPVDINVDVENPSGLIELLVVNSLYEEIPLNKVIFAKGKIVKYRDKITLYATKIFEL